MFCTYRKSIVANPLLIPLKSTEISRWYFFILGKVTIMRWMQVGVARASQLQFQTSQFTSGETKPVKLKANPQVIIYVFYRK